MDCIGILSLPQLIVGLYDRLGEQSGPVAAKYLPPLHDTPLCVGKPALGHAHGMNVSEIVILPTANGNPSLDMPRMLGGGGLGQVPRGRIPNCISVIFRLLQWPADHAVQCWWSRASLACVAPMESYLLEDSATDASPGTTDEKRLQRSFYRRRRSTAMAEEEPLSQSVSSGWIRK